MEEQARIAANLGIDDVFALRRVSSDQLVNLVGVGRGEGWAGNISIDPEREPLVAAALTSHELVRHSGDSVRVFGPYWTQEAAIVMVGDFVVVLGGPGVNQHDDATLIEAAGDLAWSAGEVSAEKRLADELEVTKAALSVASLWVSNLDGFLADLADAAIDALSCEFGAVILNQPERRLVLAPNGWCPDVPESEIRDSLADLIDRLSPNGGVLESPRVDQDLSLELDGGPIGFSTGLVSRCIVPLNSQHLSGAVVVAHTVQCPRGFTSLCQQVAAKIGDQASQVLSKSVAGAS